VEYWRHVEYFPHHYDIPQEAVCELLGTLSYNTIATLTAEPGDSIYSFSPEEMNAYRDNIMSLIKLKESQKRNAESREEWALETEQTNSNHNEGRRDSDEEINSFVTSSMARLMGMLVYERFANFHGCQGARLSRRQKVRPPATERRTTLMKILSPILFYAPDLHLRNIEDIWIDHMVQQVYWKAFITNLIREWEGLVLYSTVLLNANIAFLALPAVVGQTNNQGPGNATAAEIASQMSAITSVGSVVTSMLLARYHKPKEESSENAARSFFFSRSLP